MTSPAPESPSLSRSQVLLAIAATAVFLGGAAMLWKALLGVPVVPLGFTLPRLVLGLGLGIVLSLLGTLLYDRWAEFRQATDSYLELVVMPLHPIDLLWLGVLPALSEEFLFRGVAIPGLGGGAIAAAVSAIVFGLLHAPTLRQWPYALWATSIGLGFGAIVLLDGSLTVAIAAHATTNALSGAIWQWRYAKRAKH